MGVLLDNKINENEIYSFDYYFFLCVCDSRFKLKSQPTLLTQVLVVKPNGDT